jgi:hypothetical protein
MKRSAFATSSASLAMPAMRRNAIVSALAASAAIAMLFAMKPAHAYDHAAHRALPSVGALANISVIDRTTGQTLPVYRYRGEYWVAGNPGSKYSIAVNNRLGERVLAVMSVDGVNVMNGDTAATHQTGYVFNRYQRYEVAGWRKSDQEIAAFTFVASPRSYAERTGRPDNVGTIGVALFREKYEPPRYSEPTRRYPAQRDRYDRYEQNDTYKHAPAEPESAPSGAPPAPRSSSPAPVQDSAKSHSYDLGRSGVDSAAAQRAESATARRVEEKLGTGHGAREWSSITRTQFVRATESPAEVITIRYDSPANLISMGVLPPARAPWDRSPNPFPDSHGSNGYVPDPPRWYR